MHVKGVIDNGKRLQFKLRSGTNAQGQEMKRWGRGEGKCESCNMGVIEDVEIFVMQCPKYEKRRKIFLKDLCCVNKKKLDPHEIFILLLSSDIECSAESKLNFFELANKFLNDIYEARILLNFVLIMNPTLMCRPLI